MSFNWSKFGQSMQKLGQTMFQGTMLYAMRDMGRYGHHHGMMGQSIWTGGCRCRHGIQGMYNVNYGMPMGLGMPSMNIWHPMYADNTTNPYLIQQGMNQAGSWGLQSFYRNLAAIQAQNAQQTLLGATTPTSGLTTPQDLAGVEFENDLATKGEHTFVTELWTKINKQESAPQSVIDKLGKAYSDSLLMLGVARTYDIDEKYGNNSTDAKDTEKLTAEEFAEYAKDKFGESATQEKIDLAFDRLDTNDDGSISTDELTTAYFIMDEKNDDVDGKITKDDYNNFITELTNKDSDIETELKTKNTFREKT